MFDGTQILGMNARNRLYLPYNSKKGRMIADSKILMKKRLTKCGLPVPGLIKVFRTPQEVFDFDWLTLSDNWVLKPCSGFGGAGILAIKKRAKYAGEWRLMDGSKINIGDLRLHTLDILAGQYSLHDLPDTAFIEERIKIRGLFYKLTYQGTPDIRVIVFNKVPVMTMLRLATPESKGKANIHQGAIAVGIDLATGITMTGVLRGEIITEIPWSGKRLTGIKLPEWSKILTLAVKVQEVIPEMGYVGVDIMLDKERGPMVLEINARPGLEIQNANLMPLKKRLERVEGLEIINAEHGVRVAKALFAGRYADRVMAEEGIKIINGEEKVRVVGLNGKTETVLARIDTGATRSSVDKELARKLGMLKKENILWKDTYRSAVGVQPRPIVGFHYWLAGRKIKSTASVTDRSKMKYPVLIGRNDLGGFLVRAV